MISAFWHLGEFRTGEEWQVILKTTDVRYPELERHIVERHEWTNPEITAIPLVAGLAPYFEWVERATSEWVWAESDLPGTRCSSLADSLQRFLIPSDLRRSQVRGQP